jgi:DNA-binding SARP family transcriptional activator
MEFRVLGPVRALKDGQDLALGRRRERLVLGLLLLEHGRLITNDRLADLVWDGDPPVRALDGIKVAVSRLRSCLKNVQEVAIRSQGHGYLIDVEPAAVDAYCFRSEVEQALATADLRVRVEALGRALSRWYGPVLAGVADTALRARIGLSLEHLQLRALSARFDAEMRLDGPHVVIPDLVDLVAAHPLHERFVVLLMRALFDGGQPADALRVYHQLSARVANDLGVDPGPHARDLFAEILQADRGP